MSMTAKDSLSRAAGHVGSVPDEKRCYVSSSEILKEEPEKECEDLLDPESIFLSGEQEAVSPNYPETGEAGFLELPNYYICLFYQSFEDDERSNTPRIEYE